MSMATWMAIVGTVALLPGLYGAWEAVRRRKEDKTQALGVNDRVIVKSALELLKPYETKVAKLEGDLQKSADTVTVLQERLQAANQQISVLNHQLTDAHTELNWLRFQVKTMSAHFPPDKEQ